MQQDNFKVYGYRWVMLGVFMLAIAINQLLWITFASVTGSAAKFYGVSDLSIGLLSMSFMIVYIVVSIPASWVIDTYGLRVAVGIGAALTAVFGLLRGLWAANYTLVLIAQVGIAIGQPFLLNSITTVAARWFPIRERATASGLGSLAMYLGIFLIFARERPASPPCPPGMEVRSLAFEGFKQMFRRREFILLLVIFFIGLGVFNSVTTWIEDIVRPNGFTSTQAGVIGGLMIVGGILGALVLPTLSDSRRKRMPFILVALGGATLGLIGVTYASTYWLLIVSAFVMGFFLLSAGPIGFQYGAEITHPTPEGTSNGLLILMGQISGILFIFAMDAFRSPVNGSMSLSLVVLIGLMVLALVLAFFLHEPKIFLTTDSNPSKPALEKGANV